MISLPFGFLVLVCSLVFSFDKSSWHLYQNQHSILIVVVGTFGLGLFTIPIEQLKGLSRNLAALFRQPVKFESIAPEIRELGEDRAGATMTSTHEMISYARELWAQGVSADLFIALISQKNRDMDQKFMDSIQALKNLAKYPPALGMLGTVMGMVSLFSSIDGNKTGIGLSLSMAMTATFFGLVLSNFIIAPLADRLQVHHVSMKRLNQSVYELLILINRGEPGALIEDELKVRKNAA